MTQTYSPAKELGRRREQERMARQAEFGRKATKVLAGCVAAAVLIGACAEISSHGKSAPMTEEIRK